MVSEAVVSPAFGVLTKPAKDGPNSVFNKLVTECESLAQFCRKTQLMLRLCMWQAIKMQADELSREVVRYKTNPSTPNYSSVNTTSSTLGTAQSSPFAHAKYFS